MDSNLFKNYDLSRAILSFADRGQTSAPLERDVSKKLAERAEKLGLQTGTQEMFIPAEVFARTLDTSGASALQSHDPVGYHDVLNVATFVGRLGASFDDSLAGRKAHSMLTGDVEASWVADDEAPSESSATADQVEVEAKVACLWITVSRALLKTGGERLNAYLLGVMRSAVARAIDRAAFAGTGSDNQPTGLVYHPDVPVAAIGANGGAPSWSHLANMRETVLDAGADAANCGFATNPKVGRKLMTTPWISGDGTRPVYDPNEGTLLGARAVESSLIPSDLTKGTSSDCSAIIFGDWSQLIVSSWGGISVIVDPFTLATSGRVRMTVWWTGDITVIKPTAFCVVKDARAS